MTTDGPDRDVTPGDPTAGLDAFIRQLLGLFAVSGAIGASQAELFRQRGFQADTPTLLAAAEAIDAWRRGLISEAELSGTMRRHGLSEGSQEALVGISERLLGAGELLDLWRRDEIDQPELDRQLQQQGYRPEDIARLEALAFPVAGGQDVIRWAVREVFTPELRTALGLDANFPTSALPSFKAAGIDEERARNEWAAHWSLPSVQMAFEMFQRSEIDEQRLRFILRAQDVLESFHDPIIAVAYNPITRVDIRRIHKMLGKDRAWLLRRYRDVGYSPADAEELADFTEELNAPETEDVADQLRRGFRARAVTGYINGRLSADTLRDVLADLGHSEEEVEAFIADGDFQREADLVQEAMSPVRRLYTQAHWTAEETVAQLVELGLSEDESRRQLIPWRLERELREETAEQRAERDLTKTEIRTMYRERIVDEAQASEVLGILGYDAEEVTALIALEDLRADRERESVVRGRVRTQFLEGVISHSQASAELDKLGVTADHRAALLERWDAEFEARRPQLTRADLAKALKKDLMTREDVDARLELRGYSPEDRDILLALWAAGEGDAE